MTGITNLFSKLLLGSFMLFLYLTACSNQATTGSTVVPTLTNNPTFTSTVAPTDKPKPTSIPTVGTKPRNTPTPTKPPIPNPTMDPSEQVWYSTAIAINETARAESWAERSLTQSVEATQIAQFPVACDGSSSVSPDGKWMATSCGYKRDQTLVVQNQEEAKWVLDFSDFVSPDSPEGIPGALVSKFWSTDGNYLYFTIVLGYSGGGNDCFPGIGEYGLFRLNLKTGEWTTQIPSTDAFPGYDIKFSPTGRRYAADTDGLTIVDLKTGEVAQLDFPSATNLSWSPDGQFLAFSVASCGEQLVESSSVYIWDALINQTQLIFTAEKILLEPISWVDNLTLRIKGEERIGLDSLYIIYIINIHSKDLLFMGTVTPYPNK